MVPFPEGKGEPTPETNGRVLEITILIIPYAFNHGFGDTSRR